MKTKSFITFCLVLLACCAVPVHAATIDPVKFYLVDTNNNDRVKIKAFNWPKKLDLDWSYDGTNWSDWSPKTMKFDTTSASYTGWLYLSILTDGFRDVAGDVTFIEGGVAGNPNWYSSLFVKWSDSPQLSYFTVKNSDAISPIPIGSSALLLGSGVFGLIMMVARRRN